MILHWMLVHFRSVKDSLLVLRSQYMPWGTCLVIAVVELHSWWMLLMDLIVWIAKLHSTMYISILCPAFSNITYAEPVHFFVVAEAETLSHEGMTQLLHYRIWWGIWLLLLSTYVSYYYIICSHCNHKCSASIAIWLI